jgi:hypothetical protein
MLKAIEQQAAAARDARHDRPDGNGEHLSNFGVGKLFHVA